MNWLSRYRLQLYIRNSIWIFPALSIFGGLITISLISRFERWMGWDARVGREIGIAIMGTVAASTFTLLVLVSSAVLLAVQLASGQLTPRMITLVYRNRFRKLALSIFAFTFTFSVGVLARIEDGVPLLSGYLAAYGFLLNLALFLILIDGVGKTLRPSAVLQNIALLGRMVVSEVYPRRIADGETSPRRESPDHFDRAAGRAVLSKKDGVVLAFDRDGLIKLASATNCVIELVPEVGDLIAKGDVLFRVFEGGDGLSDDLLRDSVALGAERTLEQDPMFAFRIMVDIASRALSPAVNDPTTAVLAIDQIHNLLREVGGRHLADGRDRDQDEHIRLIYRTPDWEDFVNLAVTEIRHYGRDSIQVNRRLRAMLENLIESLPEKRAGVLRKEIDLLDASVRRNFPDAYDQELAETSDLQGVGGSPNGARVRVTSA